MEEDTGAKDVADAAEDAEADKMTVRHLPPTNRDKDAEAAGCYSRDRQDSSRSHPAPGVTIHQQCPHSILSNGSQITMCVICAGLTSKTATHPPRAHESGKSRPIKKHTRKNAQGYIAAGWDACTKGKHKNLFPGC